jgi:hypothetical protein
MPQFLAAEDARSKPKSVASIAGHRCESAKKQLLTRWACLLRGALTERTQWIAAQRIDAIRPASNVRSLVVAAADGQLEPGTYLNQRWTEDLKGDLGAAQAVPGTFFAVFTMSSAGGCIASDPDPVCNCDLITTALSFAGGFVGQIALDSDEGGSSSAGGRGGAGARPGTVAEGARGSCMTPFPSGPP